MNDPVTGLERRMSNRPIWYQQWDLRYDATDFGLVYGASTRKNLAMPISSMSSGGNAMA